MSGLEKIAIYAAGLIPSILTTFTSYSNYITSFFDREPAPDATRTIPEIIESRGFRSETHHVTTADGYTLTLFRIINPFVKRNKIATYPMILAHGSLCDAGQWLINSDDGHLNPNRNEFTNNNSNNNNGAPSGSKGHDKRPKQKMTNNMGFLLANEGYDVWLLNFRGSKYSRVHRKYSAKDAKFWDFSHDEVIQHDLPACIDYVMHKTAQQQVGYIGHSLGSIAMFGLLSQQPDYNDKIKPFIALSPSIYMSRLFQDFVIPFVKIRVALPSVIVRYLLKVVDILVTQFGPGEVKALHMQSKVISYIGSGNMFQYHMSRALQAVLSPFYIHTDIDPKRLSVFAAQMHFWMSWKQLSHFIQQIIYREFSHYDYGDEQNQKIYGEPDPPLYQLKDITNTSIALLYGKADNVHSQKDIEDVISALHVPLVADIRIKDDNFSTFDFSFSSKLGTLLNPEILKILRKVKVTPIPAASAASANGTSSSLPPVAESTPM